MAEMPAEIPAGYGMEKKIIGKPPGKRPGRSRTRRAQGTAQERRDEYGGPPDAGRRAAG